MAALTDTRLAFDHVATTYHRENGANPILCAMRERTVALVTASVPAGAALLDLGCGPGTDAVRLARQGYRITAVDWSPAMAGAARGLAAEEHLAGRVDVHTLGIHELEALPSGAFDGVYSDFGPLNCVPDLRSAAEAVARRLRPGGVLIASVIGRLCPWEFARYGCAGEWGRARVRFARSFVPVPLEGRTVWTKYYWPSEFTAAFGSAGFRVSRLEALGLFFPPPYMQGLYRRHPAVMSWLEGLEQRVAHWPMVRQCGDHFLIAMTRS